MIFFTILFLLYVLGPSSSKSEEVSFVVTEGESLRDIAHNLKDKGLIKGYGNDNRQK